MTHSLLKFRFPLAIALAIVGASAVAQVETGTVQEQVRLSDTGAPIVHVWVDRKVNYADLDLTTTAGSAEFVRRVTEAAKEACAQVHGADPADLSDMDDDSCVRTATDGALKQAKAVIDQRHKPASQVSRAK
jgi:UrcA family protein